MPTGLDPKYIQQRYQRMSDEELIRVSTQDASGLTPEAMDIVKAEIQKRNLSDTIGKGIEAQNREYTIEEIDTYCDLIRNLPCPTCGSNATPLNATLIGEVVSVIVFSTYDKRIKLGCPRCLDKEAKKATFKSAIFGWWGIPWGPVYTLQAFALNAQSFGNNADTEPNDLLRSVVLARIGEVEAYKDDKQKLGEIVARQNRM